MASDTAPIPSDGPAITIAALFSSTGALAQTEQSVLEGALLAAEQINASGGVLGRPLQLKAIDYCSDPAIAGRHAREAVQRDGLRLLVGGFTSASRVSISPAVAHGAGVYVYPTYYEGLESDSGTVYLGAVPNQYYESYVAWILESLGTRIYIIGSDYVYPRTISAITRALAREAGAEIVGDRYVPIGATELSRIVEEIVQLEPDVVVCNLVGVDSVGALYRSLAEAGIPAAQLPVAATVTSELEIREVGAELVAGHYMVSSYFSSLPNDRNTAYVEALRHSFGPSAVPHVTQVGAYNAIWVLSDAISRAGTDEPEAVLESIVGARYDGNPEGSPIEIQRNRHSAHPAYIGRALADGSYAVISSMEPIEPDPYPPSIVRLGKRPPERH